MNFFIRTAVTAASLWAATALVPGIEYRGDVWGLALVAIVFGLVNAFVRPIMLVLTCPLVLLTLGLFIFVLNGAMLLLTSALAESLGLGFHVASLWDGFLGAIVVSIVSSLLSTFVADEKEVRER